MSHRTRIAFPLLIALTIAGCSERIVPSAPAPVVTPRPPQVTPPLAAAGWENAPVAPGNWVYRRDDRGSVALFGVVGADAALVMRCLPATGRVIVSRPGSIAGTMTLRATTSVKSFPTVATGATPSYVAATVMASDPILDALAFSRGRFMVSVAGGAGDLIVPPWPEVTRVIEDCRGG